MEQAATNLHQLRSRRRLEMILSLHSYQLKLPKQMLAWLLAGLMMFFCLGHAAMAASPVRALTIDVSQNDRITQIAIEMSRSVKASLFTLDRPYRLVVDFPTVDFGGLERKKLQRSGMVQDYRFGPLSKGMSRLVLDIARPFKLIDARAEYPENGNARLRFDLAPVSLVSFRRQGVPPQLTPNIQLRGTTVGQTEPRKTKPVIVIDPGHGGLDPGAAGYGRIQEKRLVLKVGLALRDRLHATNRFKVVMTRDRDVFVPLDERVEIARNVKADLFVSLHADAIAQQSLASSISGATIYTLSKRASDARAKRLADKENAADQLAGLPIASNAARDQVEGILYDLMQRETVSRTDQFKDYLVRSMQRQIAVARSPHRSAAFRVLRQPQTPSVLIELGYMSNPSELRRMQTKAWQQAAVSAIASAIQTYFDTHGN